MNEENDKAKEILRKKKEVLDMFGDQMTKLQEKASSQPKTTDQVLPEAIADTGKNPGVGTASERDSGKSL